MVRGKPTVAGTYSRRLLAGYTPRPFRRMYDVAVTSCFRRRDLSESRDAAARRLCRYAVLLKTGTPCRQTSPPSISTAGAFQADSAPVRPAAKNDLRQNLLGAGIDSADFVLLLLALLLQYTTAFDGISHLSKSNKRQMRQSPFLVGGKGLIKRPPRIGKLLKVRSSLR